MSKRGAQGGSLSFGVVGEMRFNIAAPGKVVTPPAPLFDAVSVTFRTIYTMSN